MVPLVGIAYCSPRHAPLAENSTWSPTLNFGATGCPNAVEVLNTPSATTKRKHVQQTLRVKMTFLHSNRERASDRFAAYITGTNSWSTHRPCQIIIEHHPGVR